MVLFLSINFLCRTKYNVFIKNHAKIFKDVRHLKSLLRNRIIKNGGFLYSRRSLKWRENTVHLEITF